jgi:hypothetical protein
MKFPGNGPCPDPRLYILVRNKEGAFWRLQRGKGAKGATLNAALQDSSARLKVLSPAAAKLVAELRPFLNGLRSGRIKNRISGLIGERLSNSGRTEYRFFKDLDFQPDYPLGRLLRTPVQVEQDSATVSLRIQIPAGGAIAARNSIVSSYCFVLIMIVGDPLDDKELATYQAASRTYPVGESSEDCVLELLRPNAGEHWLLCLRLVSYEGAEVAYHERHSGMKVVGWG